MDKFKVAQHHELGIGGIHCYCCNNNARKGHGRVDKKLNRSARARIKVETFKIINDEL